MAVGNNIKKYRGIKNLSLQDLAIRVGVTKTTIQRYETGDIKIDMERISDIAEALNLEIYQMIEGAEDFFGFHLEGNEELKTHLINQRNEIDELQSKIIALEEEINKSVTGLGRPKQILY